MEVEENPSFPFEMNDSSLVHKTCKPDQKKTQLPAKVRPRPSSGVETSLPDDWSHRCREQGVPSSQRFLKPRAEQKEGRRKAKDNRESKAEHSWRRKKEENSQESSYLRGTGEGHKEAEFQSLEDPRKKEISACLRNHPQGKASSFRAEKSTEKQFAIAKVQEAEPSPSTAKRWVESFTYGKSHSPDKSRTAESSKLEALRELFAEGKVHSPNTTVPLQAELLWNQFQEFLKERKSGRVCNFDRDTIYPDAIEGMQIDSCLPSSECEPVPMDCSLCLKEESALLN